MLGLAYICIVGGLATALVGHGTPLAWAGYLMAILGISATLIKSDSKVTPVAFGTCLCVSLGAVFALSMAPQARQVIREKTAHLRNCNPANEMCPLRDKANQPQNQPQ